AQATRAFDCPDRIRFVAFPGLARHDLLNRPRPGFRRQLISLAAEVAPAPYWRWSRIGRTVEVGFASVSQPLQVLHPAFSALACRRASRTRCEADATVARRLISQRRAAFGMNSHAAYMSAMATMK